MKHHLTIIATSILLSACGGSDDQCAPLSHINLTVGPGDSLQAHDEPMHPSYILRMLLDKEYPGLVTVTNIAVPGATSQASLAQDIGTADIYVSDMGLTNDASAGIPITQSLSNLHIFADHRNVIWQTPVAIDTLQVSPPFQTEAQAGLMVGYGIPTANWYSAEISIPGWQQMTLDGLHPDPVLYQLLTTSVTYPLVRAQVERLECR